MKIVVVGAGAIGGLFGSILTKNGLDVTLVDIWTEHVKNLQVSGLIVVGRNGENKVKVKATNRIEDAGTPDLIVIAVKSYDTEQAAQDCLRIIGPNTIVLTVQNGVGHIEKIGKILGYDRIIAGTTSFGSTLLGAGTIKPSNIDEITIGELDGASTSRIRNLADTLIKAGIETHVSDSIDSQIWTKLVVNVGINALTAITHLKNGELFDYPDAMRLQALAVYEAIAVARAKGISLLVNDPLKWVIDVTRRTCDNKSSMLQDIERGTRTEIDFINGAIVTEGKKVGVPTPVNEVLTLLIKTIEKRGDKSRLTKH
jgi:2-dehydropantoate 2-reductase